MDETRQPGIRIAQIFLERADFSHREDPLTAAPNTHSEPDLEMNFQGGVSPDKKTGFVRIRVQTKPGDRTFYKFDVTMIAVVSVEAKQENLAIEDYVRTAAPVMLLPFLREAVASITGRGRFGPVWLSPFNVALVLKNIQAASEEKGSKIQRPSRTLKKRPKAKAKT